ncbi:hypothetical protein JOF41_000996 [Saccharothrix coeruleofusca]|uniref:DUF4232 domain-containing protein n=1 Tax=Saccharothrix coeruleofusca TaxID=33919 RepID=UPI001AE576E1|nr:DUF4232 domain-containing protein [Saccharothrix coeruleofusca]MBP2334818.1 hypothetical protein [Saccharothrix coeruleofusca]
MLFRSMTSAAGMAAGVCAAGLALWGCGAEVTGQVATPPAGSPSATSDQRAVGAPQDDRCRTADLDVGLGSEANHDMRGTHLPLQFTNTGSQACTLHGAPGVSYVTGEGGEQIGLPATRETDGPVVTLAPGQTASAGLFESSAPLKTPDCRRVDVGGLRVYPPGSTDPVFVAEDAVACEPPMNGPFLGVGPVEPGPDNTGL